MSKASPKDGDEPSVPVPNTKPIERWLHVTREGVEVYYPLDARPDRFETPTFAVTLLPGGKTEETRTRTAHLRIGFTEQFMPTLPALEVRHSKGWVKINTLSNADCFVFQRPYKGG